MAELNLRDRFADVVTLIQQTADVDSFTAEIDRLNEYFPLLYAGADGATKKDLVHALSEFILVAAEYQYKDAPWLVASVKSAMQLTMTLTTCVEDFSLIPASFPSRLRQTGLSLSRKQGGSFYNEVVAQCAPALVAVGQDLEGSVARAYRAKAQREKEKARMQRKEAHRELVNIMKSRPSF